MGAPYSQRVPFGLVCAARVLGHKVLGSPDIVGFKNSSLAAPKPGQFPAPVGLVNLLLDPATSQYPSPLQRQPRHLLHFCILSPIVPSSFLLGGLPGKGEKCELAASAALL